MAQRCGVVGTGVQSGNRISHSNRKTKRRFLPNLQNVSFLSKTLGKVKLCVTAATIRSIDHNGGLDDFLLSTSNARLTAEAVKLKKKIRKSQVN